MIHAPVHSLFSILARLDAPLIHPGDLFINPLPLKSLEKRRFHREKQKDFLFSEQVSLNSPLNLSMDKDS